MIRWTMPCAGVVAVALFSLVSCGDEQPVPVGEVAQALPDCRYDLDVFEQFEPGDKEMHPVDTHLCWLTKISGNFEAGHSKETTDLGGVVVRQRPPQGQIPAMWELHVAGEEQFGAATCVPLECFTGGGEVPDLVITSDRSTFATCIGCSQCALFEASGLPEDARHQAIIMQGFPGAGSVDGGGEYVWANQAYEVQHINSMIAQDCSDNAPPPDSVAGYGVFFGLGDPQNHKAQFIGPNGDGDFLDAGTYEYINTDDQPHHDTVAMAKEEEGICFLTMMGGKFRGGGEELFIYLKGDPPERFWELSVKQASEGEGVRAAARCIKWDQRN